MLASLILETKRQAPSLKRLGLNPPDHQFSKGWIVQRFAAGGGTSGRADRSRRYARVRTRGPSAVIATVCSKCAAKLPSAVTTVHLSGSVFVAGSPAVIIGSIASVIPSRSRGPRFGEP